MARAGDLVEERARPELREAGGAARPAAPSVAVPVTGKKPGRRKGLLIVTVLVLIGAVVGGIWWYLGRGLESTDDAFVDGDIASLAPRVGGTALAPQALKLSARQVLEVPLPVDRDAWSEGARLLRSVAETDDDDERRGRLLAAGRTLTDAHGLVGAEAETVTRWWAARAGCAVES